MKALEFFKASNNQVVASVATHKNQVATPQSTNNKGVASVAVVATQNNKVESKNDTEKSLIVTVYTPNGQAMQVLAKDQAHADFLIRMNPPPHESTPILESRT